MAAHTMAVTGIDFDKQVLQSSQPVLVDFWAPWCGPCRMVGPVVDALAAEYHGRAGVVKLNVDEEPALCARYQIMSVPSLLLFKGGQVVDRVVGAVPKEQLVSMLERHLGS